MTFFGKKKFRFEHIAVEFEADEISENTEESMEEGDSGIDSHSDCQVSPVPSDEQTEPLNLLVRRGPTEEAQAKKRNFAEQTEPLNLLIKEKLASAIHWKKNLKELAKKEQQLSLFLKQSRQFRQKLGEPTVPEPPSESVNYDPDPCHERENIPMSTVQALLSMRGQNAAASRSDSPRPRTLPVPVIPTRHNQPLTARLYSNSSWSQQTPAEAKMVSRQVCHSTPIARTPFGSNSENISLNRNNCQQQPVIVQKNATNPQVDLTKASKINYPSYPVPLRDLQRDVIVRLEAGVPKSISENQNQSNVVSSSAVLASTAALQTVTTPVVGASKPFQCPDCKKHFSTQSGHAKHRQLHCTVSSEGRAFSCKHCGKAYTSLSALKMHVRTHTLPCKCQVCGKSFSRPWLLQGHLRTHTGEKPFDCAHCRRSFADKSNLRAHLQTHLHNKKYSCPGCGKSFSRMSLLNKHTEGGCRGLQTRHEECVQALIGLSNSHAQVIRA